MAAVVLAADFVSHVLAQGKLEGEASEARQFKSLGANSGGVGHGVLLGDYPCSKTGDWLAG